MQPSLIETPLLHMSSTVYNTIYYTINIHLALKATKQLLCATPSQKQKWL